MSPIAGVNTAGRFDASSRQVLHWLNNLCEALEYVHAWHRLSSRSRNKLYGRPAQSDLESVLAAMPEDVESKMYVSCRRVATAVELQQQRMREILGDLVPRRVCKGEGAERGERDGEGEEREGEEGEGEEGGGNEGAYKVREVRLPPPPDESKVTHYQCMRRAGAASRRQHEWLPLCIWCCEPTGLHKPSTLRDLW
jgi:hypothetical protein